MKANWNFDSQPRVIIYDVLAGWAFLYIYIYIYSIVSICKRRMDKVFFLKKKECYVYILSSILYFDLFRTNLDSLFLVRLQKYI